MGQESIDTDVELLANWYISKVRPFFGRLASIDPKWSRRVSDFDDGLNRLRATYKSFDEELVVCVLGRSGVGKSTLINALVDGRTTTLPAGGIGPLTAQALIVRRGSPSGFRVAYQRAGQVWKLIFALEKGFAGEISSHADDARTEATNPSNDEFPREELLEIEQIASSAEVEDRTRVDAYRKQAQHIVKGNQDARTSITYLIDCMLQILGKPTRWGSDPIPADAERLRRARLALESRQHEHCGDFADADFEQNLHDHAAGFLAPLVLRMEVLRETESLPRGVTLVDLPGLGVAGDVHKQVAAQWIREKARSIILVVDHRGLLDAEATMLQESGFLNRLLFSVDDLAADPVRLMVVAVRIDEVVEEEMMRDTASEAEDAWESSFASNCDRARQLVRAHILPQLEKAWSSDGSMSIGQREVIESVLLHLEIHPVSALQYKKCLMNKRHAPPRLDSIVKTNIPGLLESLAKQAAGRHDRETSRLNAAASEFLDRVDAALRLVGAQWLDQQRPSEEADRLAEDFRIFLEPLRREFDNRQGAYRAFLRETLPEKIGVEIQKAAQTGRRAIQGVLDDLKDAHWKTLQAAVRKGGTYISGIGRQIDLPNDFATRFEVPIAEAWATVILKQLRLRTKEHATDCIKLVDEIVEWAKAQGTRVQPKLIEAQREAIRTDVKELESVGREMVDQLREEVRTRLVKKIENPIRRRCDKFVEEGQHVGPGTKLRALDLFAKLAEMVADAATGPAEKLLQERFQRVEQEIRNVLDHHGDPLDSAREAIVEGHAQHIRRSDAQRRKDVLAELELVVASRPYHH